MHPKELFIKDFTYHLPDERIAKYPLEDRSASKLLVYKQGSISHDVYKNLPDYLPPGCHLVFNNSRVIEARLLFNKPTGGRIEVFALEPEAGMNITQAMNTTGSIVYQCLVGGAAKWKAGLVLEKIMDTPDGPVTLRAENLGKKADSYLIKLSWNPLQMPFAYILHHAGQIPIPPYLQRDAEAGDAVSYQTVYAQANGSVAAPTAGLHFTPELLQQLGQQGMARSYLTLHVGAGTFMPVKSTRIEGHDMHAEYIEADRALLQRLMAHQYIIPVGTTSMRTLESLYWMGVKACHNPNISLADIEMQQWEVYDTLLPQKLPAADALQALDSWMVQHGLDKLIIKTQILIAPGYHFGLCKGLITNFHQPESTLLLLVAALIGHDWHKVYTYALENDFRFLSYGDGSLLLP